MEMTPESALSHFQRLRPRLFGIAYRMSPASALHAYTNGFWILTIGGVILFLLAPFIQKLMHGVK